ncbi:MAG: DNA cytosine methyltransferase, partial [Methanoregula sp.]
MPQKIKILSLFSGAGGLDIGFIKAGFDIVASIDNDKICCCTLKKNNQLYYSKKHKVLCKNISILDPQDLKLNNIEFIIGGPPCQTFSAAGRRAGGVKGIDDLRGALFRHYFEFIKYFKPKGFLFENVRGMIQAKKGEDWKKIYREFSSLGYVIHYRVLDAADFGVPQHRERVIIIGIKNHTYLFPRPIFGLDSSDQKPHISVGDAISDINNPNEECHQYPGKYEQLLYEIPSGGNYSYFTSELGHPNPKFAWRSKFSNFLYKADPNLPCRTIVASPGKWSGPFHWKNRKFSISELKRIQTFPDDYIICGTETEQLKQIGNSVAPKFAEILAKSIMNQIFDRSLFSDLEYIEPNEKSSFDHLK